MQKGQTVLEFLFIILIVLIYITTLVVPLTTNAQTAITDTEKVAIANNETQKIANSIQKVSVLGDGTRQTISIFTREDTTINCTKENTTSTPKKDAKVSFTVTLKLPPYPTQCPQGICTKDFPLPGVTLNCQTASITPHAKTSIIIEKNGAETIFKLG